MALTGDLRKLLVMNVIGNIIFIYIGIFINLYIWEEGKQIFDVSWFNLFMFLSWAFCFLLGAHLLTKYSIRLVFFMSAASGGLVFLSLTFLHLDNRLLWIAIIGIMVGMVFGLFFSAQNLSLSLFGKGEDFRNYFAALNIIKQLSMVTVPIISALIIKWLGYTGSFIMMFALICCMIVISFFLPYISLSKIVKEEQDTWYKHLGWNKVFTGPRHKWLIPTCIAAGLFLQFQNLFVLIFTFSVTEDKIIIALLNTGYTLFAFLALLVFNKVKFKEQTWLLFGAALLSSGFLIALIPYSPMLILSNLLSTVGMFYFSNIWMTQLFRSVHHYSPMQKLRVLIWRECLLCFSRCIMLVFILPLQEIKGPLFILLIVFTIASLFAVPLFLSKVVRGAPNRYDFKKVPSMSSKT